jgi:DNA-binding MarR family transcriptional regulator
VSLYKQPDISKLIQASLYQQAYSPKLGCVERSLQDTGLAVKRLQISHHRAADVALAELGISLVQWDALRHLEQNPGASLHDLAQLTFQTDQSCGALAARMEARGLIERVPGPGRAIRHRLTAKGTELRAAGGQIVDRVLAESFQPLTPAQRATFDQLLRQLLAGR